jgi:calcineurin-like phosphoesterase family protein
LVTDEALAAHDQALVDNWNHIVSKQDRVIIVGDFAFNNHRQYAQRLNGRKILVIGNHDAMNQEALGEFEQVHGFACEIPCTCDVTANNAGRFFKETHDYGCVKSIATGDIHPDGKAKKELITFCHYAMRTWPGSYAGSAHLYGHSHGRMPELDSLLSFDVGVDVWGYIPVPWEAIQKKIDMKYEILKKSRAGGEENVKTVYSPNPEDRVIATRAKNLDILRSIGLDIKGNIVDFHHALLKSSDGQESNKKVKPHYSYVMLAEAGKTNKNGLVYTREVLQKISDNQTFYWNDKSGKLIIKVKPELLRNEQAIVTLFKNRIAEAGISGNDLIKQEA